MFKSEKWKEAVNQVNEKINHEFLSSESDKITPKEFQDALEAEQPILDKIKNAVNLRVFLPLVRSMQSLLIDYTKGAYTNCEEKNVRIIVFTLLYVLMPYDLIPDFIPGIGYFDDAAVLSICKENLIIEIEKYKAWQSDSEKV